MKMQSMEKEIHELQNQNNELHKEIMILRNQNGTHLKDSKESVNNKGGLQIKNN